MSVRRELPAKLYYRIGEVAGIVGVEAPRAPLLGDGVPIRSPQKSAKGQRIYSRRDVETLLKVRTCSTPTGSPSPAPGASCAKAGWSRPRPGARQRRGHADARGAGRAPRGDRRLDRGVRARLSRRSPGLSRAISASAWSCPWTLWRSVTRRCPSSTRRRSRAPRSCSAAASRPRAASRSSPSARAPRRIAGPRAWKSSSSGGPRRSRRARCAARSIASTPAPSPRRARASSSPSEARCTGEAKLAFRGRHLLGFTSASREAVLCSVLCTEPPAASPRCAPVIESLAATGSWTSAPPPSLAVRAILGAAERPAAAMGIAAAMGLVIVAAIFARRPRPRR